jgi:hypothetical protein
VIEDALSDKGSTNVSTRPRFKLIIDTTEDDSIMRLLTMVGIVCATRKSLFKLSHMPEERSLEQLRLISGVKFAALQGNLAILSQTDSINESFYDLFNQHFRAVRGRNGKTSLYANIAVGGVSRRSLVRPEFGCVVHVRESKMNEMPAPFLNRFEKFRLSLSDVLEWGLLKVGGLRDTFLRARMRAINLVDRFGRNGLYGWSSDGQTLDSIFAGYLVATTRYLEMKDKKSDIIMVNETCTSFASVLSEFLERAISIRIETPEVEVLIKHAKSDLPAEESDLLTRLAEGDFDLSTIRATLDSLFNQPHTIFTGLPKLCDDILHMAMTRDAMIRLLQLATPESVFSKR